MLKSLEKFMSQFSKKNSRTNAPKHRGCRLELLEERALLSVVSLSAQESLETEADEVSSQFPQNLETVEMASLDSTNSDEMAVNTPILINADLLVVRTSNIDGDLSNTVNTIELFTSEDSFSTVSTTSVPLATEAEAGSYNTHDLQALRTFLEQTDTKGKKNGTKINADYNVDDPTTWNGVTWSESQTGKQIVKIHWNLSDGVAGGLDLSGCTALKDLQCPWGKLTSLNVSGCTALKELNFGSNKLTSIDVSGSVGM